jgi:hypothetical protein
MVDLYGHEPVDGWMAWMDGRIGLVFTTDHAHLRHVRMRHLQHDRVEWIRRRVDTVQQTTVRVVPFVGQPRVDGVGPAAVMGMVEAAGAIRVFVFPLYTDKRRCSSTSLPREAPSRTWQPQPPR